MKIGSCHLWGGDLQSFREELRTADQLGYDLIGIGDSPAGWHDVYISMAVAAEEAKTAKIMPFVTSPFIRHPLAAANALCSLDDLSDGRIQVGLSTGGSNILAIGHPPATQKQINDYWQAMRGLMKGETVTYEGRPVSALQHAKKIPLFYSAFGPKALKFAGENADGVILFSNDNLDLLDQKIAAVHQAAQAVGRNPEDIEICVTSFCSIRPSREQAINDLKAFIVVNGMAIRTPELLAQVPKEHIDAIHELHRRYDPSEHVVVGGKNAQLLDELKLTDYLAQFDTIAGTPEQVGDILKGMKKRGVDTFMVNLPGHADKKGTLTQLAELRNAL